MYKKIFLIYIFFVWNKGLNGFWEVLANAGQSDDKQYITSHFEIAIDVKIITIGYVLYNKYDQLLSFVLRQNSYFHIDLYITFQVIVVIKMVLFLKFC